MQITDIKFKLRDEKNKTFAGTTLLALWKNFPSFLISEGAMLVVPSPPME